MEKIKYFLIIVLLILCILHLLEILKVNSNFKLVLLILLLIVNIKSLENFSVYRSLNDNYIEDTGRIFYENPTNTTFNENRQDLNIFKKNKCSPDCCPSQYSCDRGCICIDDSQKEQLYSRGGNKDINCHYL